MNLDFHFTVKSTLKMYVTFFWLNLYLYIFNLNFISLLYNTVLVTLNFYDYISISYGFQPWAVESQKDHLSKSHK